MRAIIATLGLSLAIAGDLPAQQPNIVLILADDLGYGDVGCYNPDSRISTPNVDQLATQGMRFTDAHSPSTVCTPTRYSVLTGRMAFRLNYGGVFTGAGGPCLIAADRLTLPAMLKQRGYTTAMFGKWHIGLTFFDSEGNKILKNGLPGVQRIDYSRAIPDAPIHRGFDHFFGTACCPTTDWLYAYIDGDRIPVPPTKRLDKSTLPNHAWANDCRRGMVADDFDLEEVDMVFLDKSLKFLDEHHQSSPDKPFFLLHSLQAVHLPSFASKQFQGKSGAGPHGDFLLQFDHVVGALTEKLWSLGIADNTLVIVTSDNGPEVSTVLNMRRDHAHDGAKPWRGMKRDNWEGGHRVPLLARWPGKIKPGSTSDQTTCLTDLMATCAAVAGADLPTDAAEDSFNMLPVLLGTQPEPVREFTLHQTIRLALAIRQGDWKYLDHKGSGGNNYKKNKRLARLALPEALPDAPGQLYNLKSDPGEITNVYDQHPEIVRELKAKLEATKASGRSAPLPQDAATVLSTFAWPVPGSVVIIDTTTKKQRTAKSRYTMNFFRHEDGESMRVRHEGYEFLEIEGQDAKTERMQKLVASAEAMASVIPDYRIHQSGRYLETIDLEEMLDRIMPLLTKRMGDSDEQVARIRAQFRRPEFNELMQGTLSKYWNSWVGEWIGWDVAAGKTVEQMSEADAFGVKVPCVLRRTHHGGAPDHPGHVRLSLRAIVNGQEAVDAMVALFAKVNDQQSVQEMRDQLENATMVRHLEVITRLDTLQPAWARFEMRTTLKKIGSDKPEEQIERHEYTFAWPK
jgi:arylsulfatase A-like enzyme